MKNVCLEKEKSVRQTETSGKNNNNLKIDLSTDMGSTILNLWLFLINSPAFADRAKNICIQIQLKPMQNRKPEGWNPIEYKWDCNSYININVYAELS